MFYYKLRYTYPPYMNDKKEYIRRLKDILAVLEQYRESESKLTAGIETEGELAHVHVHFTSDCPRATIATQLCRTIFLKDELDTRKQGNKMYSLKPEVDVDENKFYRYPLKETLYEDLEFKKLHVYQGFSEEEYKELNKIAVEQHKIAKQVDLARQNRKDPVTWYEKISIHLDKISIEIEDYKQVYLLIIQFYVSQDKPPDHHQISRYSYLYLLKKNKLTIEEYFNIHHKYNNAP